MVQLDIAGSVDCDSTPSTAIENEVGEFQNWRWEPNPEPEPGLSGPAGEALLRAALLGVEELPPEAVADGLEEGNLGLGVRAAEVVEGAAAETSPAHAAVIVKAIKVATQARVIAVADRLIPVSNSHAGGLTPRRQSHQESGCRAS
jgi:hypothetical protein